MHNVHFLQSDLSKASLGLNIADYQHLLNSATHIIHSQWQVDFNMSVRSFEEHISGVANLSELSALANHNVRLIFTSSVGVVEHWHAPGPVPEAAIKDLACAGMGYGESKLISERLLVAAGNVSGVESVSLRLGQIAGPVLRDQGHWNRKEWVHAVGSQTKASNYYEC